MSVCVCVCVMHVLLSLPRLLAVGLGVSIRLCCYRGSCGRPGDLFDGGCDVSDVCAAQRTLQ